MTSSFRPLLTTAALAAALMFAACPVTKKQGAQQQAGGPPPAQPLNVVLVLSDLGIGDGNFVREAHEVLQELHVEDRVSYTRAGALPEELSVEGISGDIGLPGASSTLPGSMDLPSAEELMAEVPDCDLLVLGNPLLLERALTDLIDGAFSTEAILVLDNEGYAAPEAEPPVPVYIVRYGIKDAAFLAGVAAAQSSTTSMFIAMANESDPQAEDFLSAVSAGARFQTSGAQVATITIPVDGERGYVTPELFLNALSQVREETGPYFQSNHYIVSLGRATPTVMLALTGEPENAYVIGAYSDYRRVRPSRVVGCSVKRPGQALEHILRSISSVAELRGLAADDGMIELGLAEDAVGFTDFEYYGRYSPDSADIEQAVERIEALIRADELDYDY